MKRRNFLVALFALPFAPKPLQAEPWVPRSAKLTPEEWTRYIERTVDANLKRYKLAIEDNEECIRRNTAALLLNSPSGYKPVMGRFSSNDVKAFRRALPKG